MKGPATASKHTLLYFDAIRALSSQMVLVGHSLNLFLPAVFLRSGHPVFYMQNLGVVLFFVLSGFLVTSSLLRGRTRPGYGFGQYVLERATRILVPFVPALVIIAVLDRAVFHGAHRAPFLRVLDDGPGTFLSNLTMLYNNPALRGLGRVLHVDLTFGPYGTAAPFWTVVIEWWIYLSFGLVALFLLGSARLRVGGVALLAFALAVPVAALTQGSGLVLAWLVGMVYALGRAEVEAAGRTTHLGIAGLGAALAAVGLATEHLRLFHPLVCVGVSLAVMAGYYALRGGDDPRLGVPPIAASLVRLTSDYSYSLYLVHFSLLLYLVKLLPEDWPARAAIPIAFVAANAAAIAFWWAFERHYPAVRRRLERAVRRGGDRDLSWRG